MIVPGGIYGTGGLAISANGYAEVGKVDLSLGLNLEGTLRIAGSADPFSPLHVSHVSGDLVRVAAGSSLVIEAGIVRASGTESSYFASTVQLTAESAHLLLMGYFRWEAGARFLGPGWVSSSSLNLTVTAAVTVDKLDFRQSALWGTGDLLIAEHLRWGDATMTSGDNPHGGGPGLLSYFGGGAGGSRAKTIILGGAIAEIEHRVRLVDRVFENRGQTRVRSSVALDSHAELANATNALLLFSNDGGIFRHDGQATETAGTLTNSGAILVNAEENSSSTIDVAFTNSGLVSVTSGTLYIGTDGMNSPDGTLAIGEEGRVHLGFVGGGGGLFEFVQSTVVGAGLLIFSELLVVQAQNQAFDSVVSIEGTTLVTNSAHFTKGMVFYKGTLKGTPRGATVFLSDNSEIITSPTAKRLEDIKLRVKVGAKLAWLGGDIALSNASLINDGNIEIDFETKKLIGSDTPGSVPSFHNFGVMRTRASEAQVTSVSFENLRFYSVGEIHVRGPGSLNIAVRHDDDAAINGLLRGNIFLSREGAAVFLRGGAWIIGTLEVADAGTFSLSSLRAYISSGAQVAFGCKTIMDKTEIHAATAEIVFRDLLMKGGSKFWGLEQITARVRRTLEIEGGIAPVGTLAPGDYTLFQNTILYLGTKEDDPIKSYWRSGNIVLLGTTSIVNYGDFEIHCNCEMWSPQFAQMSPVFENYKLVRKVDITGITTFRVFFDNKPVAVIINEPFIRFKPPGVIYARCKTILSIRSKCTGAFTAHMP